MLGILSDSAEVVGFSLRSTSLTLFGVKETELSRSAATRLVTSGQYPLSCVKTLPKKLSKASAFSLAFVVYA